MPQELSDVWGNEILLTQERLSHVIEHPEMRGQETRIAETLISPDIVVRSVIDDTIRLFHRFYANTVIGDKFLCVVVKYGVGRNFVVTAYFTDKVKRGDALWKK